MSKIEEVVAYVNERKRLAENLQKILDVQNQIESTEVLLRFFYHYYSLIIFSLLSRN